MQEHIPDNDIVLEDHKPNGEEWFAPWKVVKPKQSEKVVWLEDTSRWLKISNIFTMSSEELYDVYEKLQPFLEAELARLRALPPVTFDRITIPKINRVYPKLLS